MSCVCVEQLQESTRQLQSLSNQVHEHVKRFERLEETNMVMLKELGGIENSMRKIEEEQRNCLMHIMSLQSIVKDFIRAR